MDTEVPVPGVKHGREMMLTIHRRLVSTSGISRSFHSSPPCRLHSSSETAFTLHQTSDPEGTVTNSVPD